MHLSSIRIVLCHTSHPGNIGSTARAMKTMGITQLYLVQPKAFPDKRANEMAAGADDIVDGAIVVETLTEALKGCQLVVGTSARPREITLPGLDARDCGEKIANMSDESQAAIVFGREKFGLENEELMQCQYHVMIPTNPDYCSLNLAAAVQLICYECRVAKNLTMDYPVKQDRLATGEEIAYFHEHLEKVITETGFYDPENPRRVIHRIKRLFAKAQLEEMEINILRGILRSVEERLQ